MFNSLVRPHKFTEVRESDFSSSFVVEPLETGLGIVIGNALRHVLLSCISGCAITDLRISGVLHEFSSIPGVLEDVTDIVLNMKSIRFSMNTDDSVDSDDESAGDEKSIELQAKGPCVLKAAALEGHGINVVDPDIAICTLSEDVEISMTLVLKRGFGYVQASQDAGFAGHIAMDANFSPVVSSSFMVNKARVGRSLNYDSVKINVKTDGSVSPYEVVTQAMGILSDQFVRVRDIARSDKVEDANDSSDNESTEDVSVKNDDFSVPLKDSSLPVRVVNALMRQGIIYFGDLAGISDDDLKSVPNLGAVAIGDVHDCLSSRGMGLSMDVSEWLSDCRPMLVVEESACE